MPIVAGASFGHTTPQFTFPIGGYGRLHAGDGAVRLSIKVLCVRMGAVREPLLQLQARLFQVEVALYAVHDLVPDTAFVA